MKVEKGDFVVFNYVGRFEDGEVFDTSYEDIAKEAGIYVEDRKYQPIGANVGVGELIPGLDEALIGMEVGEKKTITIPPELGYGMPKEELIINVPRSDFENAGIEPVKDMYVMTDSGIARIAEVGEENVTLDFNHPLAGKTLIFEVEIIDIQKAEEKQEA
ncbi:FKBP-type peptidyl-prolyl cis-trans isomerase [Thermococcus barophilus]|uniref:Peptidyl-prolyl cis-trans isomerase n=2 Tax=Thermococcus barophilus TaxID=55802 RepID=A0A0S1XE85_THEBA|nr:peptidylprolyl isomerase [Thermococcus barophilus]ADT84877.1 FKBP-type peptidyl-prolyl cis-trans isomerase [Thermococcus barophilus MP]ALM76116.1 Peptidylprolyl isomerase [Thermococcus barophilus]